MRRIAAILALLAVTALGTGALDYLHHQVHPCHATHGGSCGDHDSAPLSPPHNPDTCAFFVALQAPLAMAVAAVMLLIGGTVAVFRQVWRQLCESLILSVRLECRGPPAF